ncbi:hypothetical protein QWA68_016669, partial [Fusarium oxysporum]
YIEAVKDSYQAPRRPTQGR